MSRKSSTYYWSLLYALTAIFLWSLSASFAKFLQNDANYLGFTLTILLCGVVFFGWWSWHDRENWLPQLRRTARSETGPSRLRLFGALAGFGVFLLLYDLTFLYSIQEGPSVPANIINYLWPILFPTLGLVLFRRSGATFGLSEAGSLSLAFAGTALIAGGSADFLAGGFRYTYVVAFVAAVSAGLYLNFLAVAQEYVDSTQFVYFVGVLVALPAAVVAALTFDLRVQLSAGSLPYVVGYGFITFGGGQLAWGKAIKLGEDVLISSLAYLTPVLSTLFLNLFVDAPITETVAFAAILIIVSQVLLNDTFQHFSSISGAIVAVFVAALVVYVDPPISGSAGFLLELDDVIATIFAVLTGFMLNRVWQANKEENERLTDINFRLKAVAATLAEREDGLAAADVDRVADSIYDLMVSIIDLNYAKQSSTLGSRVRTVDDRLEECEVAIDDVLADDDGQVGGEFALPQLRRDVTDWLMLTQERVSRGEIGVLALLGLATVALFILNAGDHFVSSLVAIGMAGVIAFAVLKVRDYNYNRTGAASKALIEQDVMRTIDRPLYFPNEEFAFDPELRHATRDDQRVVLGHEDDPNESAFTVGELQVHRTVRYGVFGFVLVAVTLTIALVYLRTTGGGFTI